MVSTWPIRRQILVLIGVLIVPLVVLLAYGAYDRAQLRRLESEETVQQLAALASANLNQLALDTENVLEALSYLPPIRQLENRACEPVSQTLQEEPSLYANAVIFDLDGNVICAAYRNEEYEFVSVAGLEWFREATAKPGFNISRPFIGQITNRWVVMFSLPIRDDQDQIRGIFGLSVDLVYLSHLLLELDGTRSMVISVLDNDGNLVLRSSNPEQWVGRNLVGSELWEHAQHADGILEATGPDNVKRLYAVRHLSKLPWNVEVGTPTWRIEGPITRQLYRGALVTTLVTMLAIGFGLMMTWHIIRPVRKLVQIMAEDPEHLDVQLFSRDVPAEIASIASEYAVVLAARQKSEQREHLLAQVFGSAREAMLITDADNKIIAVNQAFIETTGFDELEAIGQSPGILRSERHDETFFADMWQSIEANGAWRGEIWNRRKNGEIFPCLITISRFTDDKGQRFHIGVMLDISQQKEIERRLEHLAHHDPLTELPNRYLFVDRLSQAIMQNRRRPYRKLAVLYIDLDRFKIFNDTLGHPAGDQLLVQVSNRLLGCLRESDTVSRLGGDEFAIIIADLESTDVIFPIIQNIFDSMKPPFQLNGQEMVASISMGICMCPDNARDVTSILSYADAAMYRAKAEGGNRYAFYTDELTIDAQRRLSLENDLRTALQERQFFLVYQAQYHADGRLAGCEALIRWQHPEHGMISPLEFIAIAEDIGLINDLTHWVIETACTQLTAWRKTNCNMPRVSVNLSLRKIEEHDLAQELQNVLELHSLKPGDLELEITEGALMKNPDATATLLGELQSSGVRVAIDDFGTGYSSLAYLKTFSADMLKIDRSFVTNVHTDEDNQEIARAIIALGHALKMDILAEGVEIREEYEWLKAEGCQYFQGFFFARPVTPDDISARGFTF